jgi:MazG family protein
MDPRLEQLDRLVRIVDRLRAEDGCPWDREQTLASMAPCAQEEAAEVADAVATGRDELVCEELGDLLMNVFLMSRIAEQERRFGLDRVAAQIAAKLVRRHPHVFGDVEADDAAQVLVNWERIKQEEKTAEDRRESLMDGIPAMASALLRAAKMANRAARVGFDWPDAGAAWDKVKEEIAEIDAERAASSGRPERLEAEIGDLLFAAVCAARLEKVDADLALRKACDRFDRRFRSVEQQLGDGLEEASLDEMERAWQQAKVTGA